MTKVGVHIIRSFPTGNPNRDRDGQPKSVRFGGVPRQRMSSQSLKKAVKRIVGYNATRSLFVEAAKYAHLKAEGVENIDLNTLANLPVSEVSAEIANAATTVLIASGLTKDAAIIKTRDDLRKKQREAAGEVEDADESTVESDEDSEDVGVPLVVSGGKDLLYRTDYQVYADLEFIRAVADLVAQVKEDGKVVKITDANVKDKNTSKVKQTSKITKPDKKTIADLSAAFDKLASRVLPGAALFGQMSASNPALHVDGSSLVADSISTHESTPEVDFWTSVDDYNSRGSSNLGDADFGSSVFYSYAAFDLDSIRNLLGDGAPQVASDVVAAFTEAIPSGKQRTHGNDNVSSLIVVTVGRRSSNLGNVFSKPVGGNDIIADSADRLLSIAQRLHGRDDRVQMFAWSEDGLALDQLDAYGIEESSLDDVLDAVRGAF